MITYNFRFAGFGGQGVLLMGMMLTYSGMQDDKHVTWLPSYGAEMRGGTANCTVILSEEEIASPVVQNPDIAVVMNEPSLAKFEPLVKEGGLLFVNSSLVKSAVKRQDVEVIRVDATDLANELGNVRVANMVMLGAVVARTGAVKLETVKYSLLAVMGEGKKEFEAINKTALDKGASLI